jgi:hypothetical protein
MFPHVAPGGVHCRFAAVPRHRNPCSALSAGFFEYQGPVNLSLKGFPGPILAWRPLRPSTAEGRFQALHANNVTRLVGREEEIEKLARLWALASRGAGQVALIAGEPGIGKSRLAIELQQRVRTENHLAIRYFCSPHRDASPLQPIKDSIERGAGFEISDPPALRIAKLNRMLAPFLGHPRINASLIAELLSLPSERAEFLTPQRRKELTLTTLLAIIETLAARHPLILCFEDAAIQRIAGFADCTGASPESPCACDSTSGICG